ncbi:hypothetical protein B0H12DRAFT_1237475 [Mycena haematopus]|nr:hypothetical protein B0H12DRAFT_1237475 [Mycena haematopus]
MVPYSSSTLPDGFASRRTSPYFLAAIRIPHNGITHWSPTPPHFSASSPGFMPFVQGHFCAPYLDVPTLRKQPPIFPEVTTNLFLDYLRFRQVLLLRILPEPPETLRQHLLCFTAYSIPYRHVPCVLRTSLHGFPNHHTWCHHTPFMFPRYFRKLPVLMHFLDILLPHSSVCSGCSYNLRVSEKPPLSRGTSAFPRNLRIPTLRPPSPEVLRSRKCFADFM